MIRESFDIDLLNKANILSFVKGILKSLQNLQKPE